MDFTLQPNIYSTNSPAVPNLLTLLETIWMSDLKERNLLGTGTMYILSGFSNFNAGVRFYNHIEEHISKGGRCQIILGGSSRQRMSSQQIVRKLLDIGCDVGIINRKAIFHAKCYGYKCNEGSNLVVSSGNFTSRGLTQNVEASIHLGFNDMHSFYFDWDSMFEQIKAQKFEYYKAENKSDAAFWKLLFDENRGHVEEEEAGNIYSTMLITLSSSDTSRINAELGSKKNLGSQYFWLSKESIDFFPVLNIPNQRGYKKTYQTLINVDYKDLGIKHEERVTFEAENNVDFRLGTTRLRRTKIAAPGDLAALTRIGERDYELRIFKQNATEYNELIQYAVTHIGQQGKRFGYIDNASFFKKLKQYEI